METGTIAGFVLNILQIVLLSDLFRDINHYRWMRGQLKMIYTWRGSDDELLTAWLIFGLLKCTAILGITVEFSVQCFVDIGRFI